MTLFYCKIPPNSWFHSSSTCAYYQHLNTAEQGNFLYIISCILYHRNINHGRDIDRKQARYSATKNKNMKHNRNYRTGHIMQFLTLTIRHWRLGKERFTHFVRNREYGVLLNLPEAHTLRERNFNLEKSSVGWTSKTLREWHGFPEYHNYHTVPVKYFTILLVIPTC